MIPVGLRIDVDTFRGTRIGVPALVELLAKHGVQATFFMTVGPDNMGRHLWRLLKPRFLLKMLRSNAASLYGWDILLRGTLWPGPRIGERLAEIVRLPHQAGHETGLHAWDHHGWQMNVDRYSRTAMLHQLRAGFDRLADILGTAPACSAAAGWRCNEQALLLKEQFHFGYNSDCRGDNLFRPQVNGQLLAPQIPVTLPTYDEIIGNGGIDDSNYNAHILDSCSPGRLNVYTIHAEVEGIVQLKQFEQLLIAARQRGIAFQPLRQLLPTHVDALPIDRLAKREQPGREGWLAWQASAGADR